MNNKLNKIKINGKPFLPPFKLSKVSENFTMVLKLALNIYYLSNNFSFELKLKNVDEEVQTLQLLSIEQAELNTIKSTKLGMENKLATL